MDKLVKARRPVRTALTKTFNTFNEELQEVNPSKERLKTLLVGLERVSAELTDLDNKVLDLLMEEADTQEGEASYDEEYASIEDYKSKVDMAKAKYQLFMEQQVAPLDTTSSSSAQVSNSLLSNNLAKNKLKLPKIELKRFSGEIREWLGFWSQFKRIHEDGDIEKEDKFQYLIQATVIGSRARDIVESYPPTADNYNKVIQSLKDRFGKEELLIEYYVRELLGLVVQRVSSPKGKLLLAQLYDKLESHLRALESIGMKSEKYSAMLYPLVESCLPEDILKIWLRSAGNLAATERSTRDETSSATLTGAIKPGERLDQLLSFLRREVEGEERFSLARAGFNFVESEKGTKAKKQQAKEDVPTACSLIASEAAIKNPTCVFCSKMHESKECFKAQSMSLKQKQELLAKNKCCFLCLKNGHRSRQCRANLRCLMCGKKHIALMCPDLPAHKANEDVALKGKNDDNTLGVALSSHSGTQEVVLQTLLVKVKSPSKEKIVRALFDSGSQRSYILKDTARELRCTPERSEMKVHALFGGLQSEKKVHHVYNVTVSNLQGDFYIKMPLLDQEEICNAVPRLRPGPWWSELQRRNIDLTDGGHAGKKIELLIGADLGAGLLSGEIYKLESGLVAIKTLLGWVVTGQVPGEESNGMSVSTLCLLSTQKSIENLWKLDTLGITDPARTKSREEEEQAALAHFSSTVQVKSDGRYEVALPWVEDRSNLESNRTIVENRCITMTNKLCSQGKFESYDKVIKDWEAQGIVERVPESENASKGCYLPHRAVFKEESTTKVRPVFDASFHSKGGLSLNDCLEKGPNLLEQIPPILLRFREKRIGVVADIEKAFLQISVREDDRNFLKFLWWEDLDSRKLMELRHCRVVFGVNCSPFLLAAVLRNILENAPNDLKDCAEKLNNAFYVDNCVTSVDTKQDLTRLICDAKRLLALAKFNLRGWEHTLSDCVDEADTHPTRVLGLLWDKSHDVLFCDVKHITSVEIVTRRTVLSIANKIFDPLGVCAPVSLIPKLILQESWKSELGWDAVLPPELQARFRRWEKELPSVGDVKISRSISKGPHSDGSISMHVFCDASKAAYAAVVFLRKETDRGAVVTFVIAKSRVAPLKQITVPRLELLACCIGARLARTVKESLPMQNVPIYFWTDSSTALCWIINEERWSVFVMNRVKEIRLLTDRDAWHHIPGEHNPADLPSRGCDAKQLVESAWWEGPQWLKESMVDWPRSSVTANDPAVEEEKQKGVQIVLTTLDPVPWYLRYFSCFRSVVRMVAWVLRFLSNCRCTAEERSVGRQLSVHEIVAAEKMLLKQVQREAFGDENCPQLKSLGVFTDEEGIIRVKTKITLRQDTYDFRFPIVLPADNKLVSMLISDQHSRSSHAGGTILLSILREKYWILRGRKAVRKVTSKCVQCRRQTAQGVTVEPSSLPENRVKDAAVFEVVGIDLAGPLFVKGGKRVWIVLFTCAIFRAVHLELTSSLSTKDFILSFRRFVARRGRPRVIYTDNGTNFVGTDNLLRSLNWSEILADASIWQIEWRFNPPSAAWWGGWWERLVQLVKRVLRRVVGRASLSYEELVTVLCDCESLINSRPITYVSGKPSDPVALTPAMFLHEIREVGVPDLDILDSSSLNKRLRYQQRVRDNLRQRFRSEYLGLLAQKPGKGHNKLEQLNVGDVVLVGDDNRKRINWPLAVVARLFPGKDGKARVAEVKTSTGVLTRPLQRLFPLEISSPTMMQLDEKNSTREGDPTGTASVQQPQEQKARPLMTRSGRIVKAPDRLTMQ